MQAAARFALVLVTAPNFKTGRKLVTLALQARLAACANIVSKVESHYWWKGRLTSTDEVLLVLKTRRTLLKKLESLVLEHHPYSTPEFIALPLLGGNVRYLRWLGAECPAK